MQTKVTLRNVERLFGEALENPIELGFLFEALLDATELALEDQDTETARALQAWADKAEAAEREAIERETEGLSSKQRIAWQRKRGKAQRQALLSR